MPAPRSVVVTSLEEFAAELERGLAATKARNPSATSPANWYRGHGQAKSFKLLPTLYRHPKIKKLSDLLDMERKMLDDFRRQNVLHQFSSTALPGDDWRFELLFYMQHYGVPTRLLDWSLNPFIALYFALTDSPAVGGAKKKEDAAVWVLDPHAWNRRALDELAWDRGPAMPTDKEIASYHPKATYAATDIQNVYPRPVALIGVANNARMFAQKGAFTIFCKSTIPMDTMYHKETFPPDCLLKIVIQHSNVVAMLEKLVSIGYTDSVSYPDLFGLAREIRRVNGFKA
jgi:hypothetical protein